MRPRNDKKLWGRFGEQKKHFTLKKQLIEENGQQEKMLFSVPFQSGTYETNIGNVSIIVCPVKKDTGLQKVVIKADLFKYEPPQKRYIKKRELAKKGRRVVVFPKGRQEPIMQTTSMANEYLVFQRPVQKKRRKK